MVDRHAKTSVLRLLTTVEFITINTDEAPD